MQLLGKEMHHIPQQAPGMIQIWLAVHVQIEQLQETASWLNVQISKEMDYGTMQPQCMSWLEISHPKTACGNASHSAWTGDGPQLRKAWAPICCGARVGLQENHTEAAKQLVNNRYTNYTGGNVSKQGCPKIVFSI